MTAGIILAGGKGTRLQSTEVNKVVLPLHGKPLIQYGVELLTPHTSPLIVVLGAFSESVKRVLENYDVTYAYQEVQKGTGHAVQIALPHLEGKDVKQVYVGYGDHMMFYTKRTVEQMKQACTEDVAIVMVTSKVENPLGLGRILRDSDGKVRGVVEEKDASENEKSIKEINAGFYLFSYEFLRYAIQQLTPSPISGELYLTELVQIAVNQKRNVVGLEVAYEEMGIGINTKEELEQSAELFEKRLK